MLPFFIVRSRLLLLDFLLLHLASGSGFAPLEEDKDQDRVEEAPSHLEPVRCLDVILVKDVVGLDGE